MATRVDPRLSRERVMQGAVDLADQAGIDALTMRNLASALGVEAMSLYYHVTNKEAVLDGIVELVLAEINEAVDGLVGPSEGEAWKGAMRHRILVARQVLLRHPWASGVIETRTTISLETMRYFNAVLGILIGGGFSYDLAHHAMHALGSRALGFSQELFEPDNQEAAEEETSEMLEAMAHQFPYLVGMMMEITHDDPESTLGWCDDQTEFEFGLDLLLDGLDEARVRAEHPRG